MSKITSQNSSDFVGEIDNVDMGRTQSESSFTRHTRSIHTIIKEVILGIICLFQLYLTIKITK